jgi:hypothetical protein
MIETVLAEIEFNTTELAGDGIVVYMDDLMVDEHDEPVSVRLGVQCGASVVYLNMTPGQATDLLEGIAETLSKHGF